MGNLVGLGREEKSVRFVHRSAHEWLEGAHEKHSN